MSITTSIQEIGKTKKIESDPSLRMRQEAHPRTVHRPRSSSVSSLNPSEIPSSQTTSSIACLNQNKRDRSFSVSSKLPLLDLERSEHQGCINLVSPRKFLKPTFEDKVEKFKKAVNSQLHKGTYVKEKILGKYQKQQVHDFFPILFCALGKESLLLEQVYDELVNYKNQNSSKDEKANLQFLIDCFVQSCYKHTSDLLPLLKSLAKKEGKKEIVLRDSSFFAKLMYSHFGAILHKELEGYFSHNEEIFKKEITEALSEKEGKELVESLLPILEKAPIFSDLHKILLEIEESKSNHDAKEQLWGGFFLRVIIPYMQKIGKKTPFGLRNLDPYDLLQKCSTGHTYELSSKKAIYNPVILSYRDRFQKLREKMSEFSLRKSS